MVSGGSDKPRQKEQARAPAKRKAQSDSLGEISARLQHGLPSFDDRHRFEGCVRRVDEAGQIVPGYADDTNAAAPGRGSNCSDGVARNHARRV